jgi:hypothetical protein
VLVALIARELGDGRVAQTLAALPAGSAESILGHLLLTNPVDDVVWSAVLLCAIRALTREQPRRFSSLRSGRTSSTPTCSAAKRSISLPARPLSVSTIIPSRDAARSRAWASSSWATSRSPIFGLARHQATDIPSAMVSRHSFKPRYQRECVAQ